MDQQLPKTRLPGTEAGAGRGGLTRLMVRAMAALLSAFSSVVYFLIGFGMLRVLEGEGGPSLAYFGLPAGAAFALGVYLLLARDNRVLWLVGAAFQLFAIVTYFEVAPQRTPSYEVWGVLLKVAQSLTLVLLAYLAAGPFTARAPFKAAGLGGR
jgi:hypothetical protein